MDRCPNFRSINQSGGDNPPVQPGKFPDHQRGPRWAVGCGRDHHRRCRRGQHREFFRGHNCGLQRSLNHNTNKDDSAMTKSKLQAACPRRARPGLTLVELLVVVMIMAIMLAVAVPIVRPPVEARAVREAARMVNTALASARTRAIQTGRPVGVMFEPLVAGGKTCAVLHYVQVSAPWSGNFYELL